MNLPKITSDKIKTIAFQDKEYPEILRKIKNPPKVLYCLGRIFPKENCFAMVGARICSEYGKETALEIGGEIALSGLTIVSGMAPGIDTFCHRSAVEKGKRTIAVLGTGLDIKSIYPQSNLKLAEKILETGGGLVSEYPPGTQGAKFTFPQRNRIISGLSLGVLVIEAKRKSGALITAKFAREQKKKVFAVPGSIYALNSKGCHLLIKQGAKLVENANDILKELNLSADRQVCQKEIIGETEEENLILNSLREGSLNIEKIIEKTKLSAPIAARTITILETKDKLKDLGGNIYGLNR